MGDLPNWNGLCQTTLIAFSRPHHVPSGASALRILLMPSSPTRSGIAYWIDRCIDPARRPEDTGGVRKARIVVVEAWLGLGAFITLFVALSLGDSPVLPYIQAGVAIVLTGLSLGLVRWGGHVEAAAWILTLNLALTPVFQAAVDLGIHDPALAMVMLAPLAGALTSGARLATVSAGVGIFASGVLYVLYNLGVAPEPFTTSEDAAVYAMFMVSVGSALTATTGVLYAKHTGDRITKAVGESTRLDAALRASEQRYRSLFDHIPVGMYRTGVDGRILLANATLARLIGAPSPEAARAYNAADLYVDPADRARFREAVERDGFVRRFETRWRRPDGGVRYVRTDARVALDADGRPLFYEGAVEDVTAEREARIALHRSEARFRALVQRSSDVVVVADRSDRFTFVSPAIEALLGYAPEAVMGTPLPELVHPDDRTRLETFLGEVKTGVIVSQLDLRLRHADGHSVFVEGAATALYDDPAVEGLVLNLRDVTERMRAQTVLVQAKREAEEVAALKSAFLANMSHEIRTPLTAILGFADVLREEVEDPTQGEFVGLIARSGRRLMDTLNSVLDLARLEAGRTEMAEEPVEVGALVRETVEMFGPAAAEAGLTIAADVAPGTLEIIGDEAGLARVLHNLVGNAVKFTDEGGIVVAVRPAVGSGGRRVLVEVRDTGVGIDEAFLSRVFGEFEQESSGTGRRYEGAGLGLALSRQLVERMGGTITVESEKGAGTVFTVSLPSSAAEPVEGRPLVLVVDDNERARQIAVHALADTYRVAVADGGDQALRAIEAERPAAVLLDIHLGASISGEDVMRQLRESPATAALPMVAVTAYGLPGDRERFLAAGFDAYLPKPYARADLIATLGGAIASRAPRPSAPGGGVYIAQSDEPAVPAPPPPVGTGAMGAGTGA